jgi:transposase-like protein
VNPGHHIDYKQLRQINPEAARRAVLDYLESLGGNISRTARAFGINRSVVYDILRKQASGDLSDRPRTPKHQPNKTPAVIEDKVIEAKNKTHLGPMRLSLYLAKYEQVEVAPGTIRHIIRRNRHRITYNVPTTKRRKIKREFVD